MHKTFHQNASKVPTCFREEIKKKKKKGTCSGCLQPVVTSHFWLLTSSCL